MKYGEAIVNKLVGIFAFVLVQLPLPCRMRWRCGF